MGKGKRKRERERKGERKGEGRRGEARHGEARRGEAKRREEAEGGAVGSALCVAAAAPLTLLESAPSMSGANGLF